jgi:ABC-type multidrug transport system permease subunit
VRDTGIVMVHELQPVLRDPFSVVFGLVQPLVFLALFGPLLVGSLGGSEAVILIAVMIPFGFQLHLLGALAGLALLGVLGIGLRVVHQSVLFPLMILSGMLLPLEIGPGWMQVIAKANPLAYVVDAERALFAGDLASAAVD